jgi:hypothetical protein
MEYWVNFLRSGNTLQHMLRQMEEIAATRTLIKRGVVDIPDPATELIANELSTEDNYQLLLDELADLTNEAFVDAIYLKLLGRPADAAGKNHLVRSLSQQASRQALVRDMDKSTECCIRKEKLARQTRHQLLSFVTVAGDISLGTHARSVYHMLLESISLQKEGVV